MRVQKTLLAGLAALLVLFFVAQVDSFAKVTEYKNDVIRDGKRSYDVPSDNAAPFVKGWDRGDDALPAGKFQHISALQEFWKKLIVVSYIGYQEFRDYIRLPRTGKFGGEERASERYYKASLQE